MLEDPLAKAYGYVLDVYYRSMNSFIFVYDVNDQESFSKIESAAKRIQEALNGERMSCILIGNTNGKNERVIKFNDVLDLQDEFEMETFYEYNINCDKMEDLLDFVNMHFNNSTSIPEIHTTTIENEMRTS